MLHCCYVLAAFGRLLRAPKKKLGKPVGEPETQSGDEEKEGGGRGRK
jgi:hypothetical protein